MKMSLHDSVLAGLNMLLELWPVEDEDLRKTFQETRDRDLPNVKNGDWSIIYRALERYKQTTDQIESRRRQTSLRTIIEKRLADIRQQAKKYQ